MEIEHEKIALVGPDDDVALKVIDTVRKGGMIDKITNEAEHSVDIVSIVK